MYSKTKLKSILPEFVLRSRIFRSRIFRSRIFTASILVLTVAASISHSSLFAQGGSNLFLPLVSQGTSSDTLNDVSSAAYNSATYSNDNVNAPADESSDSDIIPGEYIVVLHNAPNLTFQMSASSKAQQIIQTRGEVEAVLADHGLDAEIVGNSNGEANYVLNVYDAALAGFAAKLDDATKAALEADPRVASVTANQRVTIAQDVGNPQPNPTWGIDRIDQRDLPLDNSYTYPGGGEGVDVYIIDTGINTTHQEFAGRIVDGFSSIDDGRGYEDCNGHGTHVGGTAGGTSYGVAKKVNLYGVRVLGCGGSGDWSTVTAGINWVTSNANGPSVANMSLGGAYTSEANPMEQAVRNSIASGVVYVIASGNSNIDACGFTPARVQEAITVNASNVDDERASFSNWGATCSDIFAPGQNITSAWIGDDDAITTISGTSMAAPHVAGAAALYLSLNQAATPPQVAQFLIDEASTNRISDPSGSDNRLLYTGGLQSLISPGDLTIPIDAPFSLQLEVSGSPSTVTYAASGLPMGLSLNSATGLVSGTPTQVGLYTVSFTATTDGSSTTAEVSWAVANTAPDITNPGDQNSNEFDSVLLDIEAVEYQDEAMTFAATDLPSGLAIDSATGQISGTIADGDDLNELLVYDVTISASDSNGNEESITLSWTINDFDIDNDGLVNSSEGGNPSDESELEEMMLDDFETDQGWVIDPNGTDTATTGQWEVANPEETSNGGTTLQLDTTTSGSQALVTAGAAGANAGVNDIDGGVTSALSREIILSSSTVELGFNYTFAHLDNATGDDFLRVSIVAGNSSEVLLQVDGTEADRAGSWTAFSTGISAYAGQTIQLLVEAADEDTASLIEAAIDDIVITLVLDTDNDGVDNIYDLDSDNDSIPDIVEIGLTDSNGDFVIDDPSDHASITVPLDSDGDGTPDFLDLDSNNDGTFDIVENGFGDLDTNNDGTLNSSDTDGGEDTNNNGVDDLVEVFNDAPIVTSPGSQTTMEGDAVSLMVEASDPEGDDFTFAAAGLPDGLTIERASGLISGTPTVPGSFNVTVTATDTNNRQGSISFLWTIVEFIDPAEAIVFSMGSYTVAPDSTVIVPLEIRFNQSTQTVGAISVGVLYNSDVFSVDSCILSEDLAGACNVNESGLISLSSISITGVSDDMMLASVTFRAQGNEGDQSDLALTINSLADTNGAPITNRLTEDGQLTIGQTGTIGDVNCDDSADTVDALFIMQYVVGTRSDTGDCPLGDSATEINTTTGDVTGDGNVNTVDALFIMQCVVGMENIFCPGTAANGQRLLSPAAATSPVTVDAAAADGGVVLNASGSVGAGEFEVVYDSSVASFVGCASASSTPSARSGSNADGASAICHEVSDGLVRVSYIDPDGSAAGPLVALTFDSASRKPLDAAEVTVANLTNANGISVAAVGSNLGGELFLPLISR